MMNLNPTAFSIGPIAIQWYAILIVTGMVLGIMTASVREKKYGLKKDTVMDIALFAIPIALVCARLYYVLFSLDFYLAHPAEILNVRGGGLAIYGGVIGGAATVYVYAKIKRIPFGKLADLLVPSLILGQAIGRWGNFVNQEAYGARCTIESLHFFPATVYIDAMGDYFYATFFYESAWCFAIFAFLLIMERRSLYRRSGDGLMWYLLLYGAERACVEGLRTDSLYMGSVRVSQLLSIALMAACAVCLIWRLPPEKRIGFSVLSGVPLAGYALLAIDVFPASFALALGFSLLTMATVIFTYIYVPDQRTMKDGAEK